MIEVDIKKKCGDFLLSAKFKCDKGILAILGPSGAGKSTILKCIAGGENPDSGKIIFDGKTFFDSEKKINVKPQLRRTGILFQDYALFPHMSLFQNIMCGTKDKSYAQELIRRFQLEGKENIRASKLSGGEKQRAALARLLAPRPSLILLDEPFSALDNFLKYNLEKEIMKIAKEIDNKVILVSHDKDVVFRMSRHAAILNEGHIIEEGLTRDIFENPREEVTRNLTADFYE